MVKQYLNDGANETKFGEDWISVNSVSLAAISLIVLIKKKHVNLISNIKNDVISVGWGNTIANKGAVCISFVIGGKKVIFINCHLEAH